jgi:hypothetical protein
LNRARVLIVRSAAAVSTSRGRRTHGGRAHSICARGLRAQGSSQDSVETRSARFVSRLELVRTQPVEMTVAVRPLVEGIDVVGQVGDCHLTVLVDLFLDPLFL